MWTAFVYTSLGLRRCVYGCLFFWKNKTLYNTLFYFCVNIRIILQKDRPKKYLCRRRNSQKGGSDSETSRTRLRVSSWAERAFFAKKEERRRVWLIFLQRKIGMERSPFRRGGDEENRTPVRKCRKTGLSECSLWSGFPRRSAHKQAGRFGSFIMHGRRKA